MKSLKSIKNWTLTKSLKNNNFSFKRNYVLRFVPSLLLTNAFKSISSWKNYKPTPLLKLDKLQKHLKVNKLPENRNDVENKRVGDTTKLKNLGWFDNTTIIGGIRKTNEWITGLE